MPRKWNYERDKRSDAGQGSTRYIIQKHGRRAYRESTFAEDNNVHVQRFEVCLTVWVLIERSETDEVVVSE